MSRFHFELKTQRSICVCGGGCVLRPTHNEVTYYLIETYNSARSPGFHFFLGGGSLDTLRPVCEVPYPSET